jgi:hypothetical protein
MDAKSNRFAELNAEFATRGSARDADNGDSAKQDQGPPRPLMRELPPAAPFPVEALGYALDPAARGIHEIVRCPAALCCQSVLATASLTAQGLANVTLPIGQVSPVSLYLLSIAESGERKSTSDREALLPIRRYEAILREDYSGRHLSHRNDKEAWDKAREELKKKHKGNRQALKEALDHLGQPPKPPMTPLLTSDEPTIEGLHKSFVDGCPSQGIFSDEGGQFIAGHAMKADGGARVRAAAALSALWHGEPIKRVRGGEGTVILPNRRLSIFLQAQPDVAALWLSDQMLISQGILSRLLCCRPESEIGNRRWQDPPKRDLLDRYCSRIGHLIELTPAENLEEGLNKLPAVSLSAAAKKAWVGFYDHVEVSCKPGGDLESIRGFASKIAENAVRITAIMHMMEEGTAAKEVSEDAMARGIEIAQHYVAEAQRLYQASRVDPELQLVQRALAWITESGRQVISLPDMYQRGLNAIGDKATAKKIIDVLEDHGWLERVNGGAKIEGRWRRDVWRLVSAMGGPT